MSASSKKKLRKEQNSAYMTERQRREQSEAKKLKVYTWTFVIAMIVVIGVALGVVGHRFVIRSGIPQKLTTAITIGEHKLSSVELSYFYRDAISAQYSSWQQEYGDSADYYIAQMYGLTTTQPLDDQTYDPNTNKTWADFFIDEAIDDAKRTYALYDMAIAENFQMPEESKKELEDSIAIMSELAKLYQHKNVNDYLVERYGYGANEKSYNHYLEVTCLAYAYNVAYADTLVYDDAAMREYEKDIYNHFSSFTFSSYYMSYTNFIECSDEGNENHEHTDAEIAAGKKALKEAAEKLAKAKDTEELNKLIKEMPFNKDNKTAAVTQTKDLLYSKANTTIRNWLADKERKEGDIAALPYTTGANSTALADGYYLIVFEGKNDNTMNLANVRHLLVKFEGGTPGSDGKTEYSEKEKNAAKVEAQKLYDSWKNSENPTKESFIELIKKESDDGSKETGGLFENINPDSSYVENFLNWSVDQKRKEGDVEIIETEYGYHIMYFDSYSKTTYRDSLISEEMKAADYSDWMEANLAKLVVTSGKTSLIDRHVPMSNGSSYF